MKNDRYSPRLLQDSLPKAEWYRNFLGTATWLRFQFRGSFFPIDGRIIEVTETQVAIQKKQYGVLRIDIGPQHRLASVDVLGGKS